MEDKIYNIPSMSMFNNSWRLLLMFIENEGNPPFHFDGDLDLEGYPITSLGTLVSVGGNLNINNSRIKTLGNLGRVGGDLFINHTHIEDIGALKFVGGNIWAHYVHTIDLKDLKNKISVGGKVYDEHSLFL